MILTKKMRYFISASLGPKFKIPHLMVRKSLFFSDKMGQNSAVKLGVTVFENNFLINFIFITWFVFVYTVCSFINSSSFITMFHLMFTYFFKCIDNIKYFYIPLSHKQCFLHVIWDSHAFLRYIVHITQFCIKEIS